MKAGDTLCWSCSNSTNSHRCCWAGGKPRSDWEAVPTIIQNQSKNGTHSFIVVRCPGYDMDARYRAQLEGGRLSEL